MSARAPLLLNLLPCKPCGVERRFRMHGGTRFTCEHCGAELAAANAASAVPPSFPPRPDADTRPNDGTESTPAGNPYADTGWDGVIPGARS